MTLIPYAIRVPAAVILFVAIWELGARVDDAWTNGAPLFGLYDQSVLKTTDAFGITGKPNARYLKWKMNSQGFRSPELREGRETIICIGASETFGLYEPEGQEYPRQLERELNLRAGRERYQVINAGLPGQSLSSFTRRARNVMQRVEPTVAVLYPSLAIYIDPPPVTFVPDEQPPAKFRFRIADKLLTLLDKNLPESILTGVRRLQIKEQARGRPVFDRLPESNVARFRSDLSRLVDTLAEENVHAVLVTHANRFGSATTPEARPMLTYWRTLEPTLKEEGFPDMEQRLNDVIRDEAAQRHLTIVDAAPQFHGANDFVEFVHFTPAGAKKLAHVIADAILPVGTESQR